MARFNPDKCRELQKLPLLKGIEKDLFALFCQTAFQLMGQNKVNLFFSKHAVSSSCVNFSFQMCLPVLSELSVRYAFDIDGHTLNL
jgi:hypothetical protein